MLAVALVVATFTFGSGLQTLVSHPELYGWDWDYVLNPSSNVPPQALALLDHDSDVAAWTGYNYDIAEIDRQNVPFLFEGIGGHEATPISPPILSGRGAEQSDEIVLGAATLAQLHKHLGQTVEVTYGNPKNAPAYIPPTPLRIVGTATLPAIGFSSVVADHTSMGTGALVSGSFLPGTFQKAIASPYPTLNGPELVLLRLRAGVSASVGRANLNHIAMAANRALAAVPQGLGHGDTVSVLGVQHPAEIVNYRTMGVTPALLAAGLAAGAVVALGLTLTASVRRRRRDLALLKTLGFTQGQLATAVAWQASVAATVGIIVGVPAGIAGAVAVDPLRPSDLRGPEAHRSGVVDSPRRAGSACPCQHRRRIAGTDRRSHLDCRSPPGRVSVDSAGRRSSSTDANASAITQPRSTCAVDVLAAMRPGMAATALARTSAPRATRTISTTGTDGWGTA